jgi:hypothetical protein
MQLPLGTSTTDRRRTSWKVLNLLFVLHERATRKSRFNVCHSPTTCMRNALQDFRPDPANIQTVPNRVNQWVSRDCCSLIRTMLRPRYSKSITPNLMPSLCVDSICRTTPVEGVFRCRPMRHPKAQQCRRSAGRRCRKNGSPEIVSTISRDWSVPNVMVGVGQSGWSGFAVGKVQAWAVVRRYVLCSRLHFLGAVDRSVSGRCLG